jgi:glutamate racemase
MRNREKSYLYKHVLSTALTVWLPATATQLSYQNNLPVRKENTKTLTKLLESTETYTKMMQRKSNYENTFVSNQG